LSAVLTLVLRVDCPVARESKRRNPLTEFELRLPRGPREL